MTSRYGLQMGFMQWCMHLDAPRSHTDNYGSNVRQTAMWTISKGNIRTSTSMYNCNPLKSPWFIFTSGFFVFWVSFIELGALLHETSRNIYMLYYLNVRIRIFLNRLLGGYCTVLGWAIEGRPVNTCDEGLLSYSAMLLM